MKPSSRIKSILLLWLLWAVIVAILGLMTFGLESLGLFYLTLTEWIVYGVRAGIVVIFLIFSWRDLQLLFQRPANNMGTGLSRAWAVAHTTILEAWAGRIWLLPVLWFIAAILLIASVHPFQPSDRIPLDIRMLLSSQEYLVLIMVGVMACLSLPRERDRKTIITTASKPLSRLEIILGKIMGFSVAVAAMLLVMGIASWLILLAADRRLRSQAAAEYKIQSDDFSTRSLVLIPGATKPAPPSESLKRLADEGSLFAYNYITVPRGGMSVVGRLDLEQNPPVRYVKGGSDEKIIYRFAPRLAADAFVSLAPVGARPWFEFYFPISLYAATPPSKVQIRVSAYCNDPHRIPETLEKLLTLDSQGAAVWEPDRPEVLLSRIDPATGQVEEFGDFGEVDVEVTCITPGVYLQVIDGAENDPRTGAPPPDALFNVLFRPDRNQPQFAQAPQPRPVIRGFERASEGRQEVAGPRQADIDLGAKGVYESAVYRFAGKDLANVPIDEKGNFNLSLLLQTFKGDHQELPTIAAVRVLSLDQPNAPPFNSGAFEVIEGRLTPISVPRSFLGDPNPAKRSDMIVQLYCGTLAHSVSIIENSVRIELPQTPFVVNLFKSEFVILLESFLLIAICVACSIRLGWAIALLCTGACFIFGFFIEFIASLPDYGGLGALNYRGGAYTRTFAFQFFDSLTSGLWKVLGLIASFVPNFTIYQPLHTIANLQNYAWPEIAFTAVNTIVFVLPFLAVAYLLFRKQELG